MTKNKLIIKWRNKITRRNQNLLIMVCGATGTGKSYSAMTIAKMIDPTFSVKERVVFNVQDFMKLLNSKELKRGSVVIWDEAGVGIPAREWYTISNKAINYVLQTFRHLNLCVIFTAPSFDYIDKQTRLLFHVIIETVKIDFKTNKVRVKVFDNQFNPRMGETYPKYYWLSGVKKTRFNVGKPTKEMVKAYEKKKKIFSEELRAGVEQDVSIEQAKIEHKRTTDKDIMKTIKEEQIPLDAYTLQFKFNIGKDRAYRIISNYEKFSPSL